MPIPALVLDPEKDAKLFVKLFDEHAKEVADTFDQAQSDKENKSSQVRRFYDELVGWQERIGDGPEAKGRYEKHEAFIRMLNAKAAYAKGRGLVSTEFIEWLQRCMKQVKDPTTLKHFRLHFEAVVGYLKELRPN